MAWKGRAQVMVMSLDVGVDITSTRTHSCMHNMRMDTSTERCAGPATFVLMLVQSSTRSHAQSTLMTTQISQPSSTCARHELVIQPLSSRLADARRALRCAHNAGCTGKATLNYYTLNKISRRIESPNFSIL